MSTFADQLTKANRLAAVTQSIGFALWQLQELEGVVAGYFVLLAQAKQGMGLTEGNALIETAQSKTFGNTLHQISKAGLVSPEIGDRLSKLLADRNWLVHRSRADSRNSIHNENAKRVLLERLEAIADESLALLKVIQDETTVFVQSHGISMDNVSKVSKQLLDQWHSSDAF